MGKKRMQSPSSMNVYLQCPRKYFYQYKLKMPTSPSIHLVRGSAAHLVLETLYTLLPEVIADGYKANLEVVTKELLKKYWADAKDDLAELEMTAQELEMYYQETEHMLLNYLSSFYKKLDEQMEKNGMTFPEAFRKLTPLVEKEYKSWDHYVRGFIDVIENWDGKIRLMDYKTSKRAKMTDAYKLQLAIYALLYKLEHGVMPDEVGIYFLKHGEMCLQVDDELVKHAEFYIEQVHASTDGDNIIDYPKKQSPLCKWATGQCDFYDHCFQAKSFDEGFVASISRFIKNTLEQSDTAAKHSYAKSLFKLVKPYRSVEHKLSADSLALLEQLEGLNETFDENVFSQIHAKLSPLVK